MFSIRGWVIFSVDSFLRFNLMFRIELTSKILMWRWRSRPLLKLLLQHLLCWRMRHRPPRSSPSWLIPLTHIIPHLQTSFPLSFSSLLHILMCFILCCCWWLRLLILGGGRKRSYKICVSRIFLVRWWSDERALFTSWRAFIEVFWRFFFETWDGSTVGLFVFLEGLGLGTGVCYVGGGNALINRPRSKLITRKRFLPIFRSS